jgi:pyruvate formate lyase activating enzyme
MLGEDKPFVHEALLQQQTEGRVRCNTCERRCRIRPGALGWCRTRQNRAGTLFTLVYGCVSSLAVNPVEKKPFYHFHPGTLTLTAGGWSCNFACPWCQNWEISKRHGPAVPGYVSPSRFVDLTEENGCRGTSISFNEPSLSLEWSLEVFRLARPRGLYNTFVTNGYMTPEALALLTDAGLEAMNVDVKGEAAAVRKYCRADVHKVWRTCRLARQQGLHLEITTLVIPTVNDSPEALRAIATRIANDLAPDVPWHVTAYRPAYQFTAPPTPLGTLERAWEIGRQCGLRFVYVGNLPGHRADNTYCPNCNQVLIERRGFDVLGNALQAGCCPACGQSIAGVWE